MWFTDVHGPDFAAADLALAVAESGRRDRRFGGLEAGAGSPAADRAS